MIKDIRLVFSDIDGVWTDGGMYYDELGNELKRFNTSDSAGVLFLDALRIPLVIITGETTASVERRCRKLGVTTVYQGVLDKLSVALEVCEQKGIGLNQCAYVGDDIRDIPLLQAVGFSASPRNAPSYVKAHAHHVLAAAGGEGAFREFVEHLIGASGIERAVAAILGVAKSRHEQRI